MKREELQALTTELQEIHDELAVKKNTYRNLIRLSACITPLKVYPQYSGQVDAVCSELQDYTHNRSSVQDILFETEDLISLLNAELSKDTVLGTLQKGYEDVKDRINDAVPDEVKEACEEAATQLKDRSRQVKKAVKSKIRDWLLADDEE